MIRTAITKALVAVGAIAATLAVLTASASAHFVEYKPMSKFGSAGSEAGQFNRPVGVAVDESNGDVYVVDQGNNRVERFEADGTYLSEIDGSETPAKAFAEPTYVAVDNSEDAAKGHVYVADPNRGVVDAFDSSGIYLFQIRAERLQGITTDRAGHLWTWTGQLSIEEYGEEGNVVLRHPIEISDGAAPGIVVDSRGNVYVLDPSGCIARYSPPSFEFNYKMSVCRRGGVTLAIDPMSNNIFDDNRSSIIEWPPFGEGPGLWESTEELISGAFTESVGLAVDGNTGLLYVSDESANDIEVFDGAVPVPPIFEGAPTATDMTRSSAVIHATINGEGSRTTYHVLYVEAAGYKPSAANPYEAGAATPSSNVPAGAGGQEVEQLIGGLKPATTYHYQVVAVNQAGRVSGPDETFTVGVATPPVAVTGGSSGVEQNTATIGGTVSTNGLPSTYGFEVATSTDYGPPTGLGSVGAGLSETPVSLTLTGLQPGTTYHYRLTVTNLDGTSYGEDRTFTTSTFANTFATPPAPLPFVAVPSIAFPAETASGVVVKKKAKAKHKKARRRGKHGHGKSKAKGKKKK